MYKSILLASFCFVAVLCSDAYAEGEKTCRSGQILGGTTSRLKEDHDLKYIDARVKQKNGTECELRLEIDDEDNTFDFGTDFFDGDHEDMTASVVGGTFKVTDGGYKANIKVDTLMADGKTDGTWEGKWVAALEEEDEDDSADTEHHESSDSSGDVKVEVHQKYHQTAREQELSMGAIY